jgi:Transposase DDE domain
MVQMARLRGLLAETSRAAIDATGLETRHVSRYFIWRLGSRHKFSTYPKVTVVCDLASHFWLSLHVVRGPCVDSPQFKPAVTAAVANQPISELLGDKGYDAEHNHRLCRERLGVPSTVIAVRRNTNCTRQWPSTPYRRQMKSKSVRVALAGRKRLQSSQEALRFRASRSYLAHAKSRVRSPRPHPQRHAACRVKFSTEQDGP